MGETKESGTRVAVILLVSNMVLSLVTYSILPDRIIMHWGPGGVPDGYGSKLTGVLLMQLLQFIVFGLYHVIPRIDPEKKINTSTGYYSNLMNLMLGYFMFFNVLFITQNLGFNYNMTQVMMPAVGVLLYLLGGILGEAEPSWFVGVRTPWTLSNKDVWNSTHAKAGKVFKIWGGVAVLGGFFPTYGVWVLISSMLVSVAYLMVFSYREHKRLVG